MNGLPIPTSESDGELDKVFHRRSRHGGSISVVYTLEVCNHIHEFVLSNTSISRQRERRYEELKNAMYTQRLSELSGNVYKTLITPYGTITPVGAN